MLKLSFRSVIGFVSALALILMAAISNAQSTSNDADDAQLEAEQRGAEQDTADAVLSDELDADVAQLDEEAEDGASRFIPTEQLSQDLGVSFPVDI